MTKLSLNQYVSIIEDYDALSKSTSVNESLVEKIEGDRGKIGRILVLIEKELFTFFKGDNVPFKSVVDSMKKEEVYNILEHYDFSVIGMMHAIRQGDTMLLDWLNGPFEISESWVGHSTRNFALSFAHTVLKANNVNNFRLTDTILNERDIRTISLEEGIFPNRKEVTALGKKIVELSRTLGPDRSKTILDLAAKDIEQKADNRILRHTDLPKEYTKTEKDETLFQTFKKYFLARKTFGFLNTYAIYDNLSSMVSK